MIFARYSEVLRRPHVIRLLFTAILARLPQGMSGLAILLFLTPSVGYGRAGVATGISVAGSGLSNVLLARGVDRYGARPVLLPAALLYAAAMVGLATVGHGRYGAQLAICLAIGLVTPPISAVSRGLWPQLLDEEHVRVVYGLEATGQELIFIAGPAAVALIAGLASARAAVIVSGLVGLAGALAYLSAPPFAAPARRSRRGSRGRVLFGTGVVRYVAVGVCLTFGFSMTEIATVDFVGGRKASAAAGVVIAVWSVGSLIGGVWFGASSKQVTDRSLGRVLLIVGVGLVVAALAPDPVGLALILLVSGAAIAPGLARLYTRIGAAASEGTTIEAFGWLAVGFLVGSSLGSTFGGLSIDAVGARWTFVLAGVATLCAILVIDTSRPVASSSGRRQAPDPDAA